jgi:hypothetical protein
MTNTTQREADERKLFDAWADKKGLLDHARAARWAGWQARAATCRPSAGQVGECPKCHGSESVSDPNGWQLERIPCPECTGGASLTPTAPAEHITVIANLASVVRAQNGNRYADINELLARAEKCIATPTALQAASQQAYDQKGGVK